jgi:glyoxylase-like metal-dependent hydrolase (beta-lactamase superfamily II)
MATYQIYPLKVGEFLKMEQSTLVYQMGQGIKEKAPIVVFVIKGNGRNILVDSGPCDAESACKNHQPTIRPKEMEILNALKSIDLAPEDIDFVVLTHLHWDHCQNLGLFPGKKIYVQRIEVSYAINPLPAHYVAYEAAELGLESPWIPYRGQFEYVDGDKTLMEGLKLVFLPGHSPGFQGVLVDTTGGKYLVASDFIHCYKNWEGSGIYRRIPSGVHTDLATYYKSFEKAETICDYVLPGHDERVFEHKVYPY